MKKLLFIPVAFALVAPLTTCTNNLSATANPLVPTNSSTSKTTFAALTSNWHQYRATDGSYSAKFPGQPSESVQSDSDVQVMYEDRANNRVYLTQSVKLSPIPNPSNVDQVLVDKVLDAGIASQSQDGNTVTAQKTISLNGLKGREITVRMKQGIVMKMRMFIDPKAPALYMAAVGTQKGNLDFPEAQAFLDSVSIAQK